MIDFEALFNISYGLYIVSSGDAKRGNGFISNTVFQISAEPAKFAISCNKDNYTYEFIKEYKNFSVSVLGTKTSSEIFSTFGYKSGKNINKFEGKDIEYGQTGVPIVMDYAIATMEFTLEESYDIGTHTIFIGKLITSKLTNIEDIAMTYSYYRKERKALAPKNAPTYINKEKIMKKESKTTARKYKCDICGYIYDDLDESIEFANLPEDWTCPLCGAEKSDFTEI